MTLISSTHGKGGVRVMRVLKDGDRQEVRELTVQCMLTGEFGRAYTHADNAGQISTDTIKNIVNIVARENLGLDSEAYCKALAARFFERYEHVESVSITAFETKWARMTIDGMPHPHAFVLDANGKGVVTVKANRASMAVASGMSGFTFLKSTQSGWAGYLLDPYTTLQETDDRICATAMEARWRWGTDHADYTGLNAKILSVCLDIFATTYSASIQDSLYRMGIAALAAVPEIVDISFACPNRHYIPLDLSAFGLDNNNTVFLPTDEPHGQIECTVGR